MLIPVLACRMVQTESPMLVSCCLQDLSYAAFISSFRMGFFVPNASFNEQQHHSLQDYVETSIMLQDLSYVIARARLYTLVSCSPRVCRPIAAAIDYSNLNRFVITSSLIIMLKCDTRSDSHLLFVVKHKLPV